MIVSVLGGSNVEKVFNLYLGSIIFVENDINFVYLPLLIPLYRLSEMNCFLFLRLERGTSDFVAVDNIYRLSIGAID